MEAEQSANSEPNPNDSPFELPPIEGIPFDKDSEEARAIERILAWGEPEQPAAARAKSPRRFTFRRSSGPRARFRRRLS